MPGGAAGLQNQSGGRKVPGGFDSLPSPPICLLSLTAAICKVFTRSDKRLSVNGSRRFFRCAQGLSLIKGKLFNRVRLCRNVIPIRPRNLVFTTA